MIEYKGQRDCRHFHGVMRTELKKCCGGKKVKRHKICCEVHKYIRSDYCRKSVCPYYQAIEGEDNEG